MDTSKAITVIVWATIILVAYEAFRAVVAAPTSTGTTAGIEGELSGLGLQPTTPNTDTSGFLNNLLDSDLGTGSLLQLDSGLLSSASGDTMALLGGF